MATREQFAAVLQQVTEHLEQITSFKIEELTREEALGTQFSFKEIEEFYIRIIDLYKRVREVNLQEVPYTPLANLQGQLNQALGYFNQARDFNATQANASKLRQNLIDSIRNSYDNYYTHAIPILSIGLLNNNDLSVERAKLNQLIADMEAQRDAAEAASTATNARLNETLENAKSFSTKAGVSKHSLLFQDEAVKHESEARKWLIYTGVLLLLTVLAALGLAVLGKYFASSTEVVSYAVTKIVVISAFFYGLSITTRNYKAHKHNEVVNNHKQNALSTFETFANAAGSDEVTKNAVLLETTHCIFANGPTGYLKNQTEAETGNKIIEIIKSAGKRGE